MDFHPKYPQPFSLHEAVQLEPGVIADEIARLQNSLKHLKKTQEELHSFAREDPGDADIREAVDENETTIGSQEERITMLKLALVEKGVILPSSHYTLPGERVNGRSPRTQGSSAPAEGSLASLMQEEMPQPTPAPVDEEEDGGISL
ncbi:hypothetical protein PENSPDRAFT_680521 [Peniophora sp. CONT]|nr:hypothetical protein PENSPDRAFT_680521 [Peniophora sp. CONT]